ncbi:MAG: DUF6263 family protein [Planctomycetaceae bacterium]
MFIRQAFIAACLVASLTSLVPAQVKLERKLSPGTRTIETTTRVNQKLTIAGMETDTSSETRTTVSRATSRPDNAGQVRVVEKVGSLQITMRVMGTDYTFDSANPDKSGDSPFEMFRPVHKGQATRTTTTVFDKDGSIVTIEFDQDVLGNLPEEVKKIVASQLDVQKLKESVNEQLKSIPSDPIKTGDTWERTQKVNLGAGQVMTFSTKYTYEGEVEQNGRKLDRITAKTTAVDLALQDSPLPFTLKSSDLKPAASKQEILFDRELGMTVETTSLVQVVGQITFAVGDQEVPSTLDLTMESAMLTKD